MDCSNSALPPFDNTSVYEPYCPTPWHAEIHWTQLRRWARGFTLHMPIAEGLGEVEPPPTISLSAHSRYRRVRHRLSEIPSDEAHVLGNKTTVMYLLPSKLSFADSAPFAHVYDSWARKSAITEERMLEYPDTFIAAAIRIRCPVAGALGNLDASERGPDSERKEGQKRPWQEWRPPDLTRLVQLHIELTQRLDHAKDDMHEYGHFPSQPVKYEICKQFKDCFVVVNEGKERPKDGARRSWEGDVWVVGRQKTLAELVFADRLRSNAQKIENTGEGEEGWVWLKTDLDGALAIVLGRFHQSSN